MNAFSAFSSGVNSTGFASSEELAVTASFGKSVIFSKGSAIFSSFEASVFGLSTKSGVKFISRLFFSSFSSVLSSEAVSSEF